MMAKKPKRAISEYQKVTPIPSRSNKRKKITAHLTDRKRTRSLKNLAISKSFPSGQTEETLRQSEERYWTIIENIQDGYFENDLAGDLTFVNDALCRNLGYSREELIGMNYRQYTDEKTAMKLLRYYDRLYRTGEPINLLEIERIRKDGTKSFAEISTSLIRDSEGKPIGFRGISRDITERKRAEQALRESEEKYRNVLETMQETYYEIDLAGHLTFGNEALYKHLGYTKEQLIGKDFRQYQDEANAKKMYQIYKEIYRTGKSVTAIESEYAGKDGTKRTYEVSAALIRDAQGKPIGFRGVSRDITERKRMEEALRESEHKFRSLVENSIVGVYLIQDGVFKYVNSRGAEIHGYEIEEMVDKMGPKQTTLPEDWSIVGGNIGKRMKGEEQFTHYEFRIVTKSHEIRNLEVFGSRTMYQGRHAVLGTMLDITERKRVEEALRQSEEKYRTILENIEEAYFEDDLAGNFTFVNDVLCRLLGYTREELIGMNYRKYTDENNAKQLRELYNDLYKTGKPIKAFDLEAIKKDGTKVIYETSVFLLRDEEGKPIGFRGVSREITERKKMEAALRYREEQYRTLLETMEEGYYEVDLKGRFTFFNEALRKMHALSKEEMLGLSNRQYMDEATTNKVYKIFNQVYKTGQPGKISEWEIIKGDSEKAILESSVYLIRNAKGEPVGFRGITRNITERKRAEEALRQSEEKYRTILESIEDGYYEEDLAGNFVFFNEAICRIYGYPKEELLGLNYKKYTNEETAKRLFQIFNEMYRTGNPCKEYTYELIRKDGVKRYIEASASLKRDSSGKPIGFRGVVRDVTERKQAEEALRQSEERYRTILENIQDGYFEVDLAGNLTFMNDVICSHLGYTREELIGMNNRRYTEEKMAKELYQLFNRVYQTGEPVKASEAEYVRKDGTKLISELSISLIRDPKGIPIGFRGTSRDITERKQAEEEKLSLQEQLRQSQKMEAIGQLAGGVAHDFNNLLTVIKGYSQISLLDLKENDPLRGNIQEIEKATQRATDLTRQLLAFSRRQILDFKVVDLNFFLKDTEKMLRRIIGEDIELVTVLSKDLGKVKVDPSQIEQVIFNLAVNARDAMPSGGKLAIETANVELDEEYARAHVSVAPGRYVRLSISDTGSGMTQEVKERVFEPFFTTKEKGKGTGLGLSMVYGIVKQSNGNIWVYSEPGRGTTFRIYFPRTEEDTDTLYVREEAASFPRGSETILLVEDEESVRDLANRLLKQQGYTVLEAANGQEALRVAKEHVGETIHLLLADIVMPQMGGKELADWLKISRPNVKVLYMSGYADNAIVHHGVLDPGTHFLQKPFSLKALSSKVREVLDG
jgi:two-component system cell cycle sensor histidine kinase/response regulator CckA